MMMVHVKMQHLVVCLFFVKKYAVCCYFQVVYLELDRNQKTNCARDISVNHWRTIIGTLSMVCNMINKRNHLIFALVHFG